MNRNKGPRRRGVDQRGRTQGGEQYAAFGYPMLHSAAWRSLNGSSIKVFMELRSRFNGCNNGKLALSLDSAADILGIGKATVSRALKELQEKGFIVMMQRGHWYGRKATQWALTTHFVGSTAPTNAWKNWKPDENSSLGSKMEHK